MKKVFLVLICVVCLSSVLKIQGFCFFHATESAAIQIDYKCNNHSAVQDNESMQILSITDNDSVVSKGMIGFIMAFIFGIISAIYAAIKKRLNKKYDSKDKIPDNELYFGEWKDGKRHGQGTLKCMDGSNYVGEWKDGKKMVKAHTQMQMVKRLLASSKMMFF